MAGHFVSLLGIEFSGWRTLSDAYALLYIEVQVCGFIAVWGAATASMLRMVRLIDMRPAVRRVWQ